MQVLRMVVFTLRADRMTFEFGDCREMSFYRLDGFQVDLWLEPKRLSVARHVNDRGLTRTVGQRRDTGMKSRDAQFHCLQVVERCHAVIAVGVKLQGNGA